MKTRFTLLILLVAALFTAEAQQVPNAGFDNWAVSFTPDNWTTVDALFGGPLGFAFRDSLDKVSGAASIKLVSDSLSLAPQAGVIAGLVSLGSGSYTPGPNPPKFFGIPFAFRPDTLFFGYKYATPGADTAGLQIVLTKNTVPVLAGGVSLDTTSLWALAFVELTPAYANANVPDTLLLQFYSSFGNVGIKGSTMHIDVVLFGYVNLPSGLQEVADKLNFNVYPNPTTDLITVSADENANDFRVVISDISGKLVSVNNLEGQKTGINVSQFSNGTYIYRIADKTGNVLKQGKFNVVK